MPKKSRARRLTADANAHVDRAAGECIAQLMPPFGILMRCRIELGPCAKCAALEAEWKAMQPEIERQRAEQRAREQAAASIDYVAVANAVAAADTHSPFWPDIISRAERLLKTETTNATLAAEILKLAKRASEDI